MAIGKEGLKHQLKSLVAWPAMGFKVANQQEQSRCLVFKVLA
jgi:hypothetical protein